MGKTKRSNTERKKGTRSQFPSVKTFCQLEKNTSLITVMVWSNFRHRLIFCILLGYPELGARQHSRCRCFFGGEGQDVLISQEERHVLFVETHPCFNSITIYCVKKRSGFIGQRNSTQPNRLPPTKINFVERKITPASEHVHIYFTFLHGLM